MVLVNLFGFSILVGIGYGMWIVHQWATSYPRQLARQAVKLSREAAGAVAKGEYAEAARLDDARNAILTGLAGERWKFEGTSHDHFVSDYYDRLKDM